MALWAGLPTGCGTLAPGSASKAAAARSALKWVRGEVRGWGVGPRSRQRTRAVEARRRRVVQRGAWAREESDMIRYWRS
jgi:hypothetical protein